MRECSLLDKIRLYNVEPAATWSMYLPIIKLFYAMHFMHWDLCKFYRLLSSTIIRTIEVLTNLTKRVPTLLAQSFSSNSLIKLSSFVILSVNTAVCALEFYMKINILN